ncbi:MAG: peptidoglycan bridge formation protein FemAB [Candidatus Pacebacteria bacterium CG10_big_fil_rev_8_21_14_0_10_56_10]|nr:MAG: peptidoglycan bridge formation protein FemAB [Candidatus Pacebacteria bacterium CG10_big_fil_rev_8_21_14_0_10_56_10]
MLTRPIRLEEKQLYNQVVDHPLQSWEWGEFRHRTGVQVERIGFFDGGRLLRAYQVTFHQVPLINKPAGYLPKAFMPDEAQLQSLRELGSRHDALFIKLEPNVAIKSGTPSAHRQIGRFLVEQGARPGRPLFTRHTLVIDLTQTEQELFAKLSAKTRYNIRLAIKKGVEIYENSTAAGLETYLDILAATTQRQGFYAHSPEYFRTMWQTLGTSGMIKIFQAMYQGKVLSSWILFVFGNTLYYPYGASIREHREVMANNLLMWEMVRYGKRQGLARFDLWGSLGEEPNKRDPWYGFHRFKKGYGGDLYELVGSYDLVINQRLYPLFRLADTARWKWLRLKASLPL